MADAYDIGDDTLEVLAYVFSIDNPEKFKLKYHNDSLTKFMKNAKDIFQFTQADDFKHLVGFTDVMSSTMSASTRGLDALLENGNVNSLMYESGKAVVNVYTGEETLQTLYFERLIHENVIEKTEEFIKDTSKKLLSSADGIFVDTLNNQILCYTDEMKKSGKSMFLEALVSKGELTVDSQDELWIKLEGAVAGEAIDTGVLDGFYYNSDRIIVASIKEEQGKTIVSFYDLDAYYNITIEPDAPDNSWVGETTITCELPGNPDFASEEYLNRAPTGIWYYSIVIENGMPAQAYY